MPKRKKKKDGPVFRPLSPATRSKCRRLKEEEIYGEIMTVAERSETPLSSSAIHEHIGGPDVCSVWDLRRCLFNLQDNQIMKKTDDDSWILYEKCDDIEVPRLQKEIPDIFENEDHTPLNTDCMCSNAGERCHHLHIHCNQKCTVNYYVQNGNDNKMFIGQHADFHHTFQRPF